ncbi:MAG TPA: lysylphosphatidylglycerol synthase transmembrane domain-containing protein [Actinomycetota bacterium]|nr:lysylphosphatidylglycerol synthase transmembrane domain-containing protein [Actinomycetota bacterium]
MGRALLRRLIFFAVAAIGLYIVWPSLMSVFSSWPQLKDLNPLWFVVMLLLEVGSFACIWVLLRVALHSTVWFRIAAAQLTGNAVSRVLPGGAATGGAIQFQMLAGAGGMDPTRVATGLTVASIASTATLFALPLLTVPVMIWGAPVPRELRSAAYLGLGLSVLMIIAGAVLLTTDRPLRALGRAIEWVTNVVHRKREPRHGLPDRLVRERDLARDHLGSRWWVAILAAVGNWLLDFSALLAALVALGTRPRPSLVLLAYVLAAVLGMIPITPGGLGFVEAGLTTALVVAGVPAGTAAIATLAYRLVSYWLPLPAGLLAYGLYRRRYGGRTLASQAAAASGEPPDLDAEPADPAASDQL